MENESFANMRDIGGLFGLTSHDVGGFLKRHGYRSDEGKPTRQAFDRGMVREMFKEGYYSWNWHVGRTSAFLESLGRVPRQPKAEG